MIAETTPGIGHNSPPDPIDTALEPYGDHISEAENWLDGEPVQNEDQMKAVDALLKQIKAAARDVKQARDAATAPLHAAWQTEIARWKPTQDDLDRLAKGLAKANEAYKRKLAAEKEAAKRAAYEEAERKRREAEAAAQAADASNIEAQREAAALKQQAQDAKAAASAAAKDKVTGLRTVHRYEITDARAALTWVLRNDPDAARAWLDEYVSKRFRSAEIDGVRNWTEKEAW